MEYKKIDMTSFNLHLIKTDRFKTVNIRVCLRDTIKKEEITLRNMLASFLTYSTNSYPTKREMVLKAQDLYGVTVYTKTYRVGRFNMFNFCMSFLNEKYTEKGMLKSSIEYLNDIIFNPNFNKEEEYNLAYKFLYESISSNMKGIKENPTSYSMVRMLEEMDKNMPFSYREFGYLEDLDKITKEDLMSYYKRLINNSLVDVYVIGDVNTEEITELLEKYLIFNTFKRPKGLQIIEHEKLPKKSKTVVEKVDGNQSKLSIGCKIDTLTEFERNYVLTLYNMILGGNSESKFFQIIREKHSLAYYVYSSLNKLDNLLLIKAGISKDNFDTTVKLIKKLMKAMEKGEFEEEDVRVAKENYISLLKEIEDNENAIIETYLAKELLNLGDIEERKKEVIKVTKEDIMKVAKKVKIDTIFLLEGTFEDENN